MYHSATRLECWIRIGVCSWAGATCSTDSGFCECDLLDVVEPVRLEAFMPSYTDARLNSVRPRASIGQLRGSGIGVVRDAQLVVVAAAFATHSFELNLPVVAWLWRGCQS